MRPPAFTRWLLAATLPRAIRSSTLADMAEVFRRVQSTQSTRAARSWYRDQVFRSLIVRLGRTNDFALPQALSTISPQRQTHMLPASIVTDLRYGFKGALRNPGFTLVIVLTLGLGIGANTSIFSIVDAILLRPLPFPQSEQLVTVWADYTKRDGPVREWLSYPGMLDLRNESDIFEEISAWGQWNPTLTGLGDAVPINGAQVSAGMFDKVLQVAPTLGRHFDPSEDLPNAPTVVIVSHGFWHTSLGSDPDVLGRILSLNDVPYTIIGVMPQDFRPPFLPDAPLWSLSRVDVTRVFRGSANFRAVGRLTPGTSIEVARARATEVGVRSEQTYPESSVDIGYALFPLHADMVRNAEAPLLVLMGTVAMVLLIACVNVANLLLTRASSRDVEFAVRASLGANGARLTRQLVTESSVFAFLGGIVGVAFAYLGTTALIALAPSGVPRIETASVDLRVLGFAALLCIGATLIFGVAPGLRAARSDLHSALKIGGRGSGAGGRGGVRKALVVVQVALALVLIIGAGLMVRSMSALTAVDLGYDPNNVLTFQIILPSSRYPDRAATTAFIHSLENEIAALPGVVSAASINSVPLTGNDGDTNFMVEGRPVPPAGKEHVVWIRRATPPYFDTMKLPIVAGRALTTSDDRMAPPVIVINETMAKRIFPNENPIGQRINVNPLSDPVWREIVGVAQDVKNFGIKIESRNAAYFPFDQIPTPFMALVVRTEGEPNMLVPAVRQTLTRLDPSLAAANVTRMTDLVRDAVGSDRFLTVMMSLFAVMAYFLAAVGLYGVVSYGVARRANEMGLRIALGAEQGDIRNLVVSGSLVLALAGVGLGAIGAYFLSGSMQRLIYGVTATDPLTIGLSALALGVVALISSLIPAQRAVRQDPSAVLRQD